MSDYFIGIVKAIIALALLDFIYLKSTGNIFNTLINKIQNSPLTLRIPSTLMVYILIFTMWVVFIYNQKDRFTFKQNISRAAILGITTYGIYDFTNYAIFKDWTFNIVLMDTIWGGILYSLITMIAIYKF
jgi:uncharacterized membrane protein